MAQSERQDDVAAMAVDTQSEEVAGNSIHEVAHPSNGTNDQRETDLAPEETQTAAQTRRHSSISSTEPKLYWRSPLTMIFTYLLALGLALALHGYYSRLNGKKVGDDDEQQTSLRVGTLLAYLTASSLVGSVYFAYVQCLWWAVKREAISASALEAGFDSTKSLFSFLNPEMLSKMKLASIIALVTWCLPISTVITPATLNVNIVIRPSSQVVNVPLLQIANATRFREFAYTVNATGQGLQKFQRPRTILSRLAVAAAANGEVLQLPTPYTNATYVQQFHGPIAKCSEANSTVAGFIDAAAIRRKNNLDPSLREISNDYFAFVPALSRLNASTSTIEEANLDDSNGALRASNQLWLRFLKSELDEKNLNVTPPDSPRYLQCGLHNASYNVNFTWTNGKQTLDVLRLDVLNSVPYPTNVSYSDYDEANLAFSAFMWALNTQLVGHLSFYQDISSTGDIAAGVNANRTYSDTATNLERTSLIGSSDLDGYFAKNHAYTAEGHPSELFSAQRLHDKDFARNRTLITMIEELGKNITMSLFTNPSFAPKVPTNVTTSRPQNVYAYHPRNLFITYGVALLFSFIAISLGGFAYYSNGVSHDNSFLTIVATTREVHFSHLRAHERLGALPHDNEIAETQLIFNTPGKAEDGQTTGPRYGFGPVNANFELISRVIS